ncbi:MAG: exodeoxyribonuclease V subunit gamma [Acetatifactor sp.]|nr:exodeoxyribonuclease V subunit gamma [Acetatifactor sp.]
MALRFYFGPSDGKLSKFAYQDVIERSMNEPEQRFLVIVPDQFTMQTQKELASMHPRGGILNIDVLSFGRLSHRVLEEVDCREIPVLDDTGKSLVLQKVQAQIADRLPVLGGYLHKQGYVHEVKSAISEFMQYGLSPKDVGDLIEYSRDKSALAGKLRDLQLIYESFQEYVKDHFVTAEETLDVLCRHLSESRIVRDSVILLDGYTGFTPIQYRLVQELARIGREVTVTLTCGEGADPYRLGGEQALFYLTQKTVADLERAAKEAGIARDRGADVFFDAAGNRRGAGDAMRPATDENHATFPHDGGSASKPCVDDQASKPCAVDHASLPHDDNRASQPCACEHELAFLAKHVFRYDAKTYAGENTGEIRLFETTNPAAEVHQAALEIQRLIRREKLAYRDFVMITGDLEGYAPFVESEFERLGIPCFIDRTRSITLNPLTEFLLSALNLSLKNYSYEAVFHYLRSGMSGIPVPEIDRLENYVIELGIRGKKAYFERFARKTKAMSKHSEEEGPLEALNKTREAFAAQVEILSEKARDKACNYVDRLYDFLVNAHAEQELKKRAKAFEEAGDAVRAKEYSQIYRLVMDLLNQIYQLLGEEEVSLQEFTDIVSAGLGEIQVGTIPQGVDRILVGDMERTRFKPVKVLVFLGVNDGNIPRNTSKGGIISDVEREFLKDSQHALAPTPRQQAFIQRFYLYLNLTKPTKALYLTYSRQGSDGKALRPAYLIDSVKRMFPKLKMEFPQMRPVMEQILTPAEGRDLLAGALRDYAGGILAKEREREFYTLFAAYGEPSQQKTRDRYLSAAFRRYREKHLLREIARLTYGQILQNSVSRLETYSACAYRHFLQYGLSLKEREEFGLEAVDLGSLYHNVLEKFSKGLATANETWFSFDAAYASREIAKLMEEQAVQYGGSILKANYRNEYQMKRMERILLRTVLTLQKQLKKGIFTPAAYEIDFHKMMELTRKADESAWRELTAGGAAPQAGDEGAVPRADDAGQILQTGGEGAVPRADDAGQVPQAGDEGAVSRADDAGQIPEAGGDAPWREMMRLDGRIDRLDVAEDDRNVYVKVMDYKSGDKKFDLVALYHGLQMQLVVYVNAALGREQKRHPDKNVIPAALLYYHVEDPVIEGTQELSEDELDQELTKALRAKGIVNENPDVVRLLDGEFQEKSDAIPVERKKDGTFTAKSSVMSREGMEKLSSFVDHKLRAIGREILDGNIALNPYERGDEKACTYCPYAKVCGFDPGIPGCKTRKIEDLPKETILKLMEDEMQSP